MIYPVFSIRDVKTSYMMPTVDQNEVSAIRNFSYAVNVEGLMNYAPKDFDLFKIGEFDSEKGIIKGDIPVLICSGVDVFEDKK